MVTRDFVATGFVVKDGKTLLLFHKQLKMWLPPGGHIEPNEIPDEALIREIREETGLNAIVSPKQDLTVFSGVRRLNLPHHIQLENIKDGHEHVDLVYFCKALSGELRKSGEHDDMRWFTLNDLDSMDIKEEVRLSAKEAIKTVR